MNRTNLSHWSLALLVGALVTLGSCHRKSPAVSGSETQTGTPLEESRNEMEAEEGWDESLGVKTLKGQLTTTKGAQAMLNGVILSSEIFAEEYRAAQQRILELKGKTIEVKGEIIRHHCGPMEQCLSQGYIDFMREARYLKTNL